MARTAPSRSAARSIHAPRLERATWQRSAQLTIDWKDVHWQCVACHVLRERLLLPLLLLRGDALYKVALTLQVVFT